MNEYDQAKKEAIKNVFENIASTGKPTQEQLKFLDMVKPKKTIFDELNQSINAVEKMFNLTGSNS